MTEDIRGLPDEGDLQPDEYAEINWSVLPIYVRGAIRGILDDMTIEDANHSPAEIDLVRKQVINDLGFAISEANDTNPYPKITPRKLSGHVMDLAQLRYNEGRHEVGSHLLMLGDVLTAIARPKPQNHK